MTGPGRPIPARADYEAAKERQQANWQRHAEIPTEADLADVALIREYEAHPAAEVWHGKGHGPRR